MYGRPDPEVLDADRYWSERERAAHRHADAVAARAAELRRLLASRPLAACVKPVYGQGAMVSEKAVPIAADFAGWVCETLGEVDRCLAEAMFDSQCRDRLADRYARARAELEHPPLGDYDAGALFGDLR